MTSDVEKLIIKNEKQKELTYAENKAFMFYKEIWKFLLFIKEEEFNLIRVSFSYKIDNNEGYIDKRKGIDYTKINDEVFSIYHSYYNRCEYQCINLLFNTNINMNLFFKLISIDNFNYRRVETDEEILVCIDIRKEQIEKKINETLLKNKILKLEK